MRANRVAVNGARALLHFVSVVLPAPNFRLSHLTRRYALVFCPRTETMAGRMPALPSQMNSFGANLVARSNHGRTDAQYHGQNDENDTKDQQNRGDDPEDFSDLGE